MPSQPIRTCVACREKGTKDRFLRIARLSDGTVGIGAEGRGAYVCRNETCIRKAFSTKLLVRPLRLEAGALVNWEELETSLLENVNLTNAQS